MRNVTITLDEDLARWAKVKAAGEMKSLSRFVAEMLEHQRFAERGESKGLATLERFLAAMPSQNLGVEKLDRASLHDRKHDRKVLR